MTDRARPPRVAIIVPVRDRRSLLARTLAALDRQRFTDAELVVVDDGSTDGAGELAAAATFAGRPVRVLQGGGNGAVAARALGVGATTAPILAFTDSDCEPDPGWLAAAVECIEGGADLVHGPIVPTRVVLPLERSVSERDGGLFPSANLVVRREAHDAVGGFAGAGGDQLGFRPSERARGLGFGEDTLFGWAVRRSGRVVTYDERVLVHHAVLPADLREWLGRSWQMAAFPALVRDVPELRSTMVRHGFLLSHRSRVPLYVTLLAVLSRRPGLIGLAAGWWALHRFRHTLRHLPIPMADRVAALPAQLLLDAVQATALAAGSARARTLLL